ncbi:hypothetical protein [Myxococcus sp. RHSTA-1-4]|uniref:hypothetical protein n=1 Tax=Myxococcus sp. RHSTA-1-4 TaxID=2874601 RepID=UPI001CC0D451|nr:hypothetical protein [Myxococcus sp. RHSTA-1-4]MBZ4417007.1 hypothetical protein [Myxococcus sp. RHSTA-1-4]
MTSQNPRPSPPSPPTHADRRLTRRALLLGGGVLAPAALLLGTLAHRGGRQPVEPRADSEPLPPEVLQRLHRATDAAVTGLLPLAHQEASATLAAVPENAPALFILACVALEAGAPREAEAAVARLETRVPERPEPRLLEQLLVRRRSIPDSGWCAAFREAWANLGRPDFERDHLLTRVALEPFTPAGEEEAESWWAPSPTPARLTLALTSYPLPPERAEWLLQQLPTLEDPALFIVAASVLSGPAVGAALRRRARPVLHHRMEELARAAPKAMQLQLHRQLAGTSQDEPFGPLELEALETVAALISWREDSAEGTFLEARRRLREADVPHASRRAFSLATAAAVGPAHAVLNQRAEATRSQLMPGARHGLGRILLGVGTRLAGETLLVPRTLGLMMCGAGAEDLRDPESLARFEESSDELFAIHAEFRKAALALWPIASLQEDAYAAAARDECAFLRAFASPEALQRAMADRPDPLQCVPRTWEPPPSRGTPTP